MNLSPDTAVTLGLLGFAVVMSCGGFALALWLMTFAEKFKKEVKAEISSEMAALRSDTLGATNEHRRSVDENMKSVRASVTSLEKDMIAFRLHVSENHVTKHDFNRSLDSIVSEIRGSAAQLKSLETTVSSALKV